MKRKITRTKSERYCTVEIELESERLSITGEEGRVVSIAAARKQALDYWKSYFEEDINYIQEMNKRCGVNCGSPLAAAQYVLKVDGELHGLDAVKMDDNEVRILESCGCIHETLKEWFPEVAPLIPWHLNDMKAGCEHQEALGWGHGKTIALVHDTLTEVQKEVIEGDLLRKCEQKREKAFNDRWSKITTDQKEAARTLRAIHGSTAHITIAMVENLEGWRAKTFPRSPTVKEVSSWLKKEIEKEFPVSMFEAEIFKDSISAPCPVCGYRYGSQWLKRDLPPEIVELARNVLKHKE